MPNCQRFSGGTNFFGPFFTVNSSVVQSPGIVANVSSIAPYISVSCPGASQQSCIVSILLSTGARLNVWYFSAFVVFDVVSY